MFLEKIYASIPYVLLLLSLVVMLALFLLGRITLLINSLIVFIPCIVGSIYLIVMRKKNENIVISYPEKCQLCIPQRTLRRLFLLGAIAIFILLLLSDYTSPLFLILIAILYVLCLLQIISKDTSTGFALFSMIYTTAVFILPLFLTNAYYYGGSDVIAHTSYIMTIINTGNIPSADLISIYGLFPGLYLLIGPAAVLSGIIAHTSLCLYLPLAYFSVGFFVYHLSKQLLHSNKVGLLATYFYFLLGIIYCGYTSLAPFTFLSLLCIMIIYLAFRNSKTNKFRYYIIAALIIAISIIAHHANHIPMSLIMLVLLALDLFIIIDGRIRKEARQHVINIPIIIMYFSAVALYLYYNYINSSIRYIRAAIRTDDDFTISSLADITESHAIDFISQYIKSFYIMIIVFVILVGLYFIINSKKRTQNQHLFALFIIIFFIIFIPNVTDSLPIISQLMTFRWRGILLLFFAIAIASGLVIFIQNLSKTKKYNKILATSIVLIVGLILLFNPITAISADNALLDYVGIDNIHLEPRNSANNHFTDKDMAMFSLFSDKISPIDSIASDRNAGRYISTYVSPDTVLLYHSNLFDSDTNQSSENQQYDIIFFRKAQFEYCGFLNVMNQWSDADKYNVQIKSNPETNLAFERNVKTHDIIYKNGDDVVYHN